MGIYGMSDLAILQEIGHRLKRKRLEKNLSQQHLADAAGLNRTTISEIERGAPFGMLSLIQILRALDALEALDTFLPEPGLSPLQLAKLKGRQRQRASRQSAITPDKGESEW